VAPQHAARGLENATGYRAVDRLRAQPAVQVQTKCGSVEMSPQPRVPFPQPSAAVPTLQTKGAGSGSREEASAAQRPNETGMPDNLKAGVESLSGMSLDNVKVHYNSARPAPLNALAYAQSRDIHVAPGQEQHLPHEAWHVVKQAQGRGQPTTKMKDGMSVNDDKGLEQEANALGTKALLSRPVYLKNQIAVVNSAVHESPLQPKLLEPNQILSALSGIEFGGDLIEEKIRLSDDRFKTPQGLSLSEYALAKMKLLESARKDTDEDNHYNALLLSYTVDVVADFISRTNLINLPRIKPLLTQKLIGSFAQEIRGGIEQQSGDIEKQAIDEILRIAQAINGKDPLTLYMKDVLSLNNAADMIREMALGAKMSAATYFELLAKQFMDQVLSLTNEQIVSGEAKSDAMLFNSGNAFPQKEVVGEISSGFYKYLIGENKTYEPAENHTLKNSAEERVADLRQAVEQEPEAEPNPEPAGEIIGFIEDITGLPHEKSKQLLNELVKHLEDLTPQVTVKHGMWFSAAGLNTSPEYKSILGAQHKKEKASDIIKPGVEGEIDTLGRSGEGPMAKLLAERGPKYMRWRWDKDSRAEGIDIPFNVSPIYGCLNHWDVDKWGAGGANYYGDVHFLLKNSAVKDRCFYKFSDAGTKRKTLTGLFNDLIVHHRVTAAVILGDLIKADVAARPTTRIEVVVPGGINVSTDVWKIVVSSAVPDEVAEAIKVWAEQNKIEYFNETKEINERIENTHEPVSGWQDPQVEDFAKQHYQQKALAELASAVQVKLLDKKWDSEGSGLFGKKTPRGISKLRKILKSDKPLSEKVQAVKAEAEKRSKKKKAGRADSVTALYKSLSAINPLFVESMDTVRVEIEQLDVAAGKK
jgi:hypothetical protein